MKRWLNRNVWTLSWVSFLQDAASEMLYPLIPLYLASVLMAGRHAAAFAAAEAALDDRRKRLAAEARRHGVAVGGENGGAP